MTESFDFVSQGQCSPISGQAKRMHNVLGLGAVFVLFCSQPDTQFHSNKHEIVSKDQLQTACNWNCTSVGTGCVRVR